MKILITRSLAVISILYSGLSNSFDFPAYPSTSMLHNSSGDRNSIQINCEPISTSKTLKCQFFQMSVSYEVNPDELDKEIEKEILSITTSKDFLENDPIKEVKSMCLAKGKDSQKFKSHYNKMDPGFAKEHMKKIIAIMNRACNVNSVKEAKEIVIDMTRLDKKLKSVTCKVWPNTWEETFHYKYTTDNNYWVTNSEPVGECGVINVSTLKKDGKYFWKYESHRVITNKEGNSILFSCKDIEERTVEYSWKSKSHQVNCKGIKFGL